MSSTCIIYISEMYGNNSTKDMGRKMETYSCNVLILHVKLYDTPEGRL